MLWWAPTLDVSGAPQGSERDTKGTLGRQEGPRFIEGLEQEALSSEGSNTVPSL